MRKISKKNKHGFLIFSVLTLAIFSILGIIIYQSTTHVQESVEVGKNSTAYDKNNAYIDVTSASQVNQKWNQEYYLTLQNNDSYSLGKHSAIYNTIGNSVDVFGGGYEVHFDGTIEPLKSHTKMNLDANHHFYKLSDRRYLLIGKDIHITDNDVHTNEYLMVDIDKSGNAQLYNHSLNYKTVNYTNIECQDIVFDVPNETLTTKETKIDLTQIKGSTNEYQKLAAEDKKSSKQDTEAQINTGSSSNNGGSGGGQQVITSSNQVSNSSNTVIQGQSDLSVEEINNAIEGIYKNLENVANNQIINNYKKESSYAYMVHTSSTPNAIHVQYQIVDPTNTYKAVYLKVKDKSDDSDHETTIQLEAGATSTIIKNLKSNTVYQIKMYYTTIDDNGSAVEKLCSQMNTVTQKMFSNIEISKITNKSLYFTVKLDSNYSFVQGNVVLYEDNKKVKTMKLDLQSVAKGWSTKIQINENVSQYTLKLEDIVYLDNDEKVAIDLGTNISIGNIWSNQLWSSWKGLFH